MRLVYLPALISRALHNRWVPSPLNAMDNRLRGTAAYHPQALTSYGISSWRHQRFVWEPEDFVFGDSGGYSVATRGLRLDPRAVIRWQLARSAAGPILDSPPIRDWTRRRDCLAATVAHVTAALPLYRRARESGTPFRWWGVVHGRTHAELAEWWEAVARIYPFDEEGEGWAFRPHPLNDPEAMARVLAFAQQTGIRSAHFFATSGFTAVETLCAYGPDAGLVSASFDSTTAFKCGYRRTLIIPTEYGWQKVQERFRDSVRGDTRAREYMLQVCGCISCGLLREDLRADGQLRADEAYWMHRMMFHNVLAALTCYRLLHARYEITSPCDSGHLDVLQRRAPLHRQAVGGATHQEAQAGRPRPTARIGGYSKPGGARAMKSLRVLSCVPKQLYTFSDKLEWVEAQIKTHKPDVFVTPQEYHGGIQTIFFAEEMAKLVHRGKQPEKMAYAPDEILEPYTALAQKYKVGITVGALIDDPETRQRRERIYVIDRGDVTGFVDKMMLPAYDHINAHGKTGVHPEPLFEQRAQAFTLFGARVGVLFCWEVYSSFLWHAIARAQPDFVVSMVKFGVRGWPKKAKVDGQAVVTGFGFGNDGGWIERLRIAAKWDLAAPIICSTNSWNLPKRAGALAGQILPWEEGAVTSGEWQRPARTDTLWVSEGKGTLDTDHVQVDTVDFLYWRHIRDHKFSLFEATGEWPSSEARALTMSWKIRRMERAFASLPKLASKPARKAAAPVR